MSTFLLMAIIPDSFNNLLFCLCLSTLRSGKSDNGAGFTSKEGSSKSWPPCCETSGTGYEHFLGIRSSV